MESSESVTRGLTPTEYGYAAGIFDGEGCVMLSGRCVRVAVTNTDLPVLQAMQRWFGGSIRRLSRTVTSISGRVRNAFQWNIAGETAVRFLQRVWVDLIVKKQQALVVLRMVSHDNDPAAAKAEITRLKRVEYSA